MRERVEASGTTFWDDADETVALQRYRTLVNTIDDGIYQLDAEGRFVAVNDVVVETTGYAREQLVGEHVSKVIGEEAAAEIRRAIERELSAGGDGTESIEVAVRTADGDRIHCELRVNLLVEDGTFRGTVGVVRDVTERKRTERTLTERERQLERESALSDRVLQVSPLATVVLDRDGEVLRSNERADELLGITDNSAYAPGNRAAYDEDGRSVPPDERPFARALATGEPCDRVLQVELPDGGRQWLSIHAAPVPTDGEPDRVVATVEDVTGFKEREHRLQSELNETFARVSDAFYALDREWRITYASDRAEELLDYTGEGLVGEHIWEKFEWGADSKLGAEFRTAMETQEATSFELYYPEPLEAWYEIRAYPSETGLSVYFRDISERKERERELIQYEAIVETINDGIYVVDGDGRFTMVNEAYAELTGYAREELIGEHASKVVDEDVVRRAQEMEAAVRDGNAEEQMIEAEVTTASGERIPAEATFATLPGPEGGERRVGVVRNIADRKARERALEQSERRYRTLVENFPNGAVALFDEELRYTVAGGEIFDESIESTDGPVVGSSENVVGKTVWERYPDELAAEFEPRFRAALDGETNSFELEFHDRHWVAYTLPVKDGWGDIFAGMVMVRDVTERKARERALERSERRYRTLVEQFPNGAVALVDEDMTYRTVGGTPPEEVDATVGELEGRPIREVLPAGLADELASRYEAAFEGESSSFESEAEGRVYRFRIVPVRGDDGEVFAAMGMSQDVTEQKHRERDLRDAKLQLEAATEAGAVGTWEWHVPEDRFVAGASFARQFGVDPDAAREGVSLDRFTSSIHEADRERVDAAITEAVESCGEYESEYRVRNADGEYRWVVARGHVECDGEGNPVTFPGALTDITERKRAERALEEHRKQLETLFELLPVGVVVADADGGLVEANETAKDIWGGDVFEAGDVAEYERYRGWWADSGEPVEPEEWAMARALRGEEITEPDVYEIEAADGRRRVVMVHGMPVRDDDGEIVRAVVTQTDVTERVEREEKLEETVSKLTDSNERLESFASMLAHELRNPVTIGQIYSDQLPDEAASDAVDYVREAFDRMEDIIDVMLVLTRGEQAVGESESLSLEEAAESAWNDVAAPDATLRVETDAAMRADATFVRHLFRNLFENAVQHGGAEVTIRLGEVRDGPASDAGESATDEGVDGFYVADDGRGIPPEDRETVFEAGYTTASDGGGTGLGLAFVNKLAEVYGWSCAVTESESGGARFEFRNVEFVPDGA